MLNNQSHLPGACRPTSRQRNMDTALPKQFYLQHYCLVKLYHKQSVQDCNTCIIPQMITLKIVTLVKQSSYLDLKIKNCPTDVKKSDALTYHIVCDPQLGVHPWQTRSSLNRNLFNEFCFKHIYKHYKKTLDTKMSDSSIEVYRIKFNDWF